MDLLPYAHLTNQELARVVLAKADLTLLEEELYHRMEVLLDRIESLEDGDDS